jgi:hypothetical protein
VIRLEMHKITIVDSNFEEKSLSLTYNQLVALRDWLNIYTNTGRVIKNDMRKLNIGNKNESRSNLPSLRL